MSLNRQTEVQHKEMQEIAYNLSSRTSLSDTEILCHLDKNKQHDYELLKAFKYFSSRKVCTNLECTFLFVFLSTYMFFSPSNQKFSIKLRFNRSKCKKRLSCLSSRTSFSKCHSHTNKQNNSITTKHSRNLTALRFPLYLFFQESQVDLHLSLQPEFYRTCKEKLFTCLKKKI